MVFLPLGTGPRRGREGTVGNRIKAWTTGAGARLVLALTAALFSHTALLTVTLYGRTYKDLRVYKDSLSGCFAILSPGTVAQL